jgi:hypothetical protein
MTDTIMTTLAVEEFDNRMPDGDQRYHFGYLRFNDGLRIGYAPQTNGVDDYGLFIPEQPYLLQGQELTPQHLKVARAYVTEHFSDIDYASATAPDGAEPK